MAVDFFLKIDGIEGEATDSKHKGEIDVLSWSWGESNMGTFAGGGGGGAGKVDMQDFTFTMYTNKASPEKQEEYLVIKFSDLLVSSFQTSGSGETPVDSIALNFSKIEYEYKPQNAKGGLDAGIKVGWDLKANVKV
jgi:type VI secretion system secreted protein Hcp